MKKSGTTITENNLIKLGFELVHTIQCHKNKGPFWQDGTLKIFKHKTKNVYVGVDSRYIPNDTRMGLYNTTHTIEDVEECLC